MIKTGWFSLSWNSLSGNFSFMLKMTKKGSNILNLFSFFLGFFFCILPVFPREWSQGYEVVCFWRSRVNHGRQGTAASFLRTAIKFSFHSKYITRSFPFVFALWRHKNHHILRDNFSSFRIINNPWPQRYRLFE